MIDPRFATRKPYRGSLEHTVHLLSFHAKAAAKKKTRNVDCEYDEFMVRKLSVLMISPAHFGRRRWRWTDYEKQAYHTMLYYMYKDIAGYADPEACASAQVEFSDRVLRLGPTSYYIKESEDEFNCGEYRYPSNKRPKVDKSKTGESVSGEFRSGEVNNRDSEASGDNEGQPACACEVFYNVQYNWEMAAADRDTADRAFLWDFREYLIKG